MEYPLGMASGTRSDLRFTRDDYEVLPEGFPVELVGGQFVKEPPPEYHHQRVEVRILARLLPIVGEERVVPAPVAVVIDDFNVFEPDIAVYAAPLAPKAKHLGIPVFVVEVLSPSTAARDRRRKTGRYLRAGVLEVWLVDPDTGAIEVCTADGRVAHRRGERVTSRAVPGFSVTGAELVR